MVGLLGVEGDLGLAFLEEQPGKVGSAEMGPRAVNGSFALLPRQHDEPLQIPSRCALLTREVCEVAFKFDLGGLEDPGVFEGLAVGAVLFLP